MGWSGDLDIYVQIYWHAYSTLINMFVNVYGHKIFRLHVDAGRLLFHLFYKSKPRIQLQQVKSVLIEACVGPRLGQW